MMVDVLSDSKIPSTVHKPQLITILLSTCQTDYTVLTKSIRKILHSVHRSDPQYLGFLKDVLQAAVEKTEYVFNS